MNNTGALIGDSEKPAPGQQVIVACACIHAQIDGAQKVFVAKRAATKKFLPNVFELPGGHVDFGEDIIAGLKREIKEEFNMDINVGDPFAAFTEMNPVKGAQFVEVMYFATFTSPISQIRLNPSDHFEYRWIAESDIPSILTPTKGEEDNEIVVLRRAFELLQGDALYFGSAN